MCQKLVKLVEMATEKGTVFGPSCIEREIVKSKA